MGGARCSVPVLGVVAALLLTPGCKRAPISSCADAAACDAGADGGPGGDAPHGDALQLDALDALDVLDARDARDDADAAPVVASAACVANPAAPSYAFIGVPIDFDEDGVADSSDDCPAQKNPDQADRDSDGLGDVCDACAGGADRDDDGACDGADNCPAVWNPAQRDVDRNGVGDACDTQSCVVSAEVAVIQRALALALRQPDVIAVIAGHRWRMASVTTFCRSGNDDHGVLLTLFDYDARQVVAATLDLDMGALVSLRVTAFDANGPQASAEETYEATALARADAAVQQRAASMGHLDATIFFFEFQTDPRFATCATGRCVDVLFQNGSQIVFSAVVDLRACRVLGVVDR